MLLIQFAKLWDRFKLLKHFKNKVMTESLQNKKKFSKSSKKEAGGDEKQVFVVVLT